VGLLKGKKKIKVFKIDNLNLVFFKKNFCKKKIVKT
jgi:hypothetical protein